MEGPLYSVPLKLKAPASERLNLPWKRGKPQVTHGGLDKHVLAGHKCLVTVTLSFLPDLHAEVDRSWKKPYSAHVHLFHHANYANVEEMRKHGCNDPWKIGLPG